MLSPLFLVFYRILLTLPGVEYMHNSLDEFEFRLDPNIDFERVATIARLLLIRSFLNLQVMKTYRKS